MVLGPGSAGSQLTVSICRYFDYFDYFGAKANPDGKRTGYYRIAHLFAVTEADELTLQPACRDPNVNKLLALALVCEAGALIRSDNYLLALNPWRSIPVLLPAEFIGLDQAGVLAGRCDTLVTPNRARRNRQQAHTENACRNPAHRCIDRRIKAHQSMEKRRRPRNY